MAFKDYKTIIIVVGLLIISVFGFIFYKTQRYDPLKESGEKDQVIQEKDQKIEELEKQIEEEQTITKEVETEKLPWFFWIILIGFIGAVGYILYIHFLKDKVEGEKTIEEIDKFLRGTEKHNYKDGFLETKTPRIKVHKLFKYVEMNYKGKEKHPLFLIIYTVVPWSNKNTSSNVHNQEPHPNKLLGVCGYRTNPRKIVEIFRGLSVIDMQKEITRLHQGMRLIPYVDYEDPEYMKKMKEEQQQLVINAENYKQFERLVNT